MGFTIFALFAVITFASCTKQNDAPITTHNNLAGFEYTLADVTSTPINTLNIVTGVINANKPYAWNVRITVELKTSQGVVTQFFELPYHQTKMDFRIYIAGSAELIKAGVSKIEQVATYVPKR